MIFGPESLVSSRNQRLLLKDRQFESFSKTRYFPGQAWEIAVELKECCRIVAIELKKCCHIVAVELDESNKALRGEVP